MLGYQHAYHAGSPADLHKHATLVAVALRLAEKAKPFCLLDVFAGEGIYDLTGDAAAKTGEHERGIGTIWNTDKAAPPAIAALLACVHALNSGEEHIDSPARYPGSPQVLKTFLRAGDRLIVNELHPAAATKLRHWARGDNRIAIHKRDGLEALSALVPPKPRRGMAVIDPSYEQAGDYAATGEVVTRAAAKWPEGIFVVWYPLLADNRHLALLAALESTPDRAAVSSEIYFDLPGLADAPHLGLRGSGIVIVNPPWQLDLVLMESGNWLAKSLNLGPKAEHRLHWICARK